MAWDEERRRRDEPQQMAAKLESLRGADVCVGSRNFWRERRHDRGPDGPAPCHQPSTVTSPGQPHPVTSPAPSHRGLCGETRRRQQISAVPTLAKPQHICPPYLHTKLALSFKLERAN